MVKAYKDEPVLFLAIASNVTADAAAAYSQQTQMAMPAYPDSLGLMQARYGQKISLQNIHQTRVVSPTGKIVAYEATQESLRKLLDQEKPEWKFKGEKFDAKLQPAADALEAGQFAAGLKLLSPLRKSGSKAVAEQAEKLFAAAKKEAGLWKDEAEKAADSDPVRAYALYTKISTLFPGDELAKSVAESQKQLAASKEVKADLAAQKAWTAFALGLEKVPAAQKAQALKACQDLAKKYDGTPAGAKATELAKELGN